MSDSNGCGRLGLPVSSFSTQDQGRYTGTAEGNGPLNSQVAINGTTDLSKIIVGPSGALVESIVYQAHGGIARNAEVCVYGQGPQGIGSGSLKLTFKMQSGKEHDLSLTSSTPQCHTDVFEDGSPMLWLKWEHT